MAVDRYEYAKKLYAELGIDTDKALDTLKNVKISMHCWQGDDVSGFEGAGSFPAVLPQPAITREKLLHQRSLCPTLMLLFHLSPASTS